MSSYDFNPAQTFSALASLTDSMVRGRQVKRRLQLAEQQEQRLARIERNRMDEVASRNAIEAINFDHNTGQARTGPQRDVLQSQHIGELSDAGYVNVPDTVWTMQEDENGFNVRRPAPTPMGESDPIQSAYIQAVQGSDRSLLDIGKEAQVIRTGEIDNNKKRLANEGTESAAALAATNRFGDSILAQYDADQDSVLSPEEYSRITPQGMALLKDEATKLGIANVDDPEVMNRFLSGNYFGVRNLHTEDRHKKSVTDNNNAGTNKVNAELELGEKKVVSRENHASSVLAHDNAADDVVRNRNRVALISHSINSAAWAGVDFNPSVPPVKPRTWVGQGNRRHTVSADGTPTTQAEYEAELAEHEAKVKALSDLPNNLERWRKNGYKGDVPPSIKMLGVTKKEIVTNELLADLLKKTGVEVGGFTDLYGGAQAELNQSKGQYAMARKNLEKATVDLFALTGGDPNGLTLEKLEAFRAAGTFDDKRLAEQLETKAKFVEKNQKEFKAGIEKLAPDFKKTKDKPFGTVDNPVSFANAGVAAAQRNTALMRKLNTGQFTPSQAIEIVASALSSAANVPGASDGYVDAFITTQMSGIKDKNMTIAIAKYLGANEVRNQNEFVQAVAGVMNNTSSDNPDPEENAQERVNQAIKLVSQQYF